VHFLTQLAHESTDFHNGNEIGNKPEKAYFNKEYSHNTKVGNKGGDDGYTYRGWGYI
jgi:predicted chitinase